MTQKGFRHLLPILHGEDTSQTRRTPRYGWTGEPPTGDAGLRTLWIRYRTQQVKCAATTGDGQ
jgi:hypothetical protein